MRYLFLSLNLLAFTNPFLPPSFVPGAINPNVTQANIHKTICVHGWTKTVRPSSYYTTKLKKQQLKRLGYKDQKTRDYEEDHRVSLEVGGAPKSPKNLWPEPYNGKWNAHLKDKVENRIHEEICTGQITLKQGRSMLMGDWETVYKHFFPASWKNASTTAKN